MINKIFNLDNPFFQFLEKVFDLVICNVLFIICSAPVITMGAALAAMLQVTQDMALKKERGVVKRFFSAFRKNFKQATACTVLYLIFLVAMGCNYILANIYFTGNTLWTIKCIIFAFLAIAAAIAAYLFPLIVRYDNTLIQHLRNSLILTIVQIHRTIPMILLNMSIFLAAYFSAMLFYNLTVFYALIGFALIGYLDSIILAPVFKKLEKVE